jgi:branched-chain amino acid transport system permease protein
VLGAVVCAQLLSRVFDGAWIPASAQARGVVTGCTTAMFAVGLVLVYRANRIINFAHASFGMFAMVTYLMLRGVSGWSWYAAVPVALAVAALLGYLVELVLVRRFAKAPRLALTVVTLGVSQIVLGASGVLPAFFIDENDPPVQVNISSPFSGASWDWRPIVFTGDDIAIVVAAIIVLAAMAAFFRFTSVGVAIRGAAENNDRASLLGINTHQLSSLVWVGTAAIAALAALLQALLQGGNIAGSLSSAAQASGGAAGVGIAGAGFAVLLRALAAAVIGRMENLPHTVVAAVGIALFEQGVLWAFTDSAIVDAALLLLVMGAFLAQRGDRSRADTAVTGTWSASEEIRAIPSELRGLPTVRAGVRRVSVLIGVFVLAYPWLMDPRQTSLGGTFAIYGIVAISLVVLTGWGGQISLGQYAFVAVGAVVGGALTSKWHWPFLAAVLGASLVGAGVAVLLGLPALRIKGLFLAVTTLAFSVAVATMFLNDRFFGWLLPGRDVTRPKFLWIDAEDERVYYYVCIAGLAFAVFVAQSLRNSRPGRVLIAMRDNERAAQSFSLNLVRTRLATFAISGFLAAFAGALLVHHQHGVTPTAFPPERSVQIFIMAVIGGLGSVAGVLVGALYLGAIEIFINDAFWQLILTGFGLLLILAFYPGGLGALLFSVRDSWLRRTAMRFRIYVPSLVGDHRVLDGERSRAHLVPKFAPDGSKATVPDRYRIPSVIRERGTSQKVKAWRA